jgi:hypothetical protein
MTEHEQETLFVGLADSIRHLTEAVQHLAALTGHDGKPEIHRSIALCYNAIQETGMQLGIWQDAEPEDHEVKKD